MFMDLGPISSSAPAVWAEAATGNMLEMSNSYGKVLLYDMRCQEHSAREDVKYILGMEGSYDKVLHFIQQKNTCAELMGIRGMQDNSSQAHAD